VKQDRRPRAKVLVFEDDTGGRARDELLVSWWLGTAAANVASKLFTSGGPCDHPLEREHEGFPGFLAARSQEAAGPIGEETDPLWRKNVLWG